MKKIFTNLLVLLIIFLSFVGCDNDNEIIVSEESPQKIILSSLDYTNKDYYNVFNQLRKNGFTNISTKSLNDLTSSEKDEDNTIEKITINGNEVYEEGSTYMSDSEIIIYYHNIKKVYAPFTSDELPKNTSFEKVKNQFEKAGFANIKVEPIEDLTFGWLTADGEIESISISGNNTFNDYTTFAFDTEVVIKYHTFPNKESSDATVEKATNTILTIYNNEELAALLSLKSKPPAKPEA